MPMVGPGFQYREGADPTKRFGTIEVVRALVVAAARAQADVVFGNLSAEQGGPIEGHASHQAGRDVDVMFGLNDAHGHPFASKSIPLDEKGEGFDFRDLSTPSDDILVRLDAARTWRFVAALLEQTHADVGRIFVAEHLHAVTPSSRTCGYCRGYGATFFRRDVSTKLSARRPHARAFFLHARRHCRWMRRHAATLSLACCPTQAIRHQAPARQAACTYHQTEVACTGQTCGTRTIW